MRMRSSHGTRSARWRPFALLLGLGGTCATWAQPPGITERVANTSLLIDLTHDAPPPTISASGAFSDVASQTPSPGLIPYSVNSQLWSDGAHKVRYLALPGTSQIGFSASGAWAFPANTVLVKSFYLERVSGDPSSRRIVETRLLVKVGDTSQWEGLSYMWDEDGAEAALLPTGHVERYTIADAEAPGGERHIDYSFPAPEDCGRCHTLGAGPILGVRTAQLNGQHDYGTVVAHQLQALDAIGLFSNGIGADVASLPRWENPLDEGVPLEARARAYLASNCAHCHRPGGLRRTEIDLRYDTPLDLMGIVDVPSELDDLDGVNRHIVSPGDAANSVLPRRMELLDERRMPPLATGVVDASGGAVISAWIDAMGTPTLVTEHVTTPASSALPSLTLHSHPNPFNAAATVSFTLHHAGAVKLGVFALTGRRVRTLVAAHQPPGRYESRWDGRDDEGRTSASGVYLLRLQQQATSRTIKLTLLR